MVSTSVYPPLGQVTELQVEFVNILVLLELDENQALLPWEVTIWYSTSPEEDGQWAEQTLSPSGAEEAPSSLCAGNGMVPVYFSGVLPIQSKLHFTVKLRAGSNENWRWVRDELGIGDGVIVLNNGRRRQEMDDDLPDIIHDLNPDLKWKSLMSQSPGTQLWSLEVAVAASEGDQSTIAEVPLGVPWGSFLRWFALVRIWSPWLAPRHGKARFKLEEDAVLVSFLSPLGRHMVFLAISGIGGIVTLFRSSPSGAAQIYIRNDEEEATSATILVATGDSFESANAAVMYHARTLVLSSRKTHARHDTELATIKDNVKPEWYENWYDGLGFCTWNALGQRLTEDKVLGALDRLAENRINITSLIIDDNWQDIDYRGDGQFQYGWRDFEAEPKTFPNGLKATIKAIREKHKNIQHIAVWHALLGYWGGISPDGHIGKTYKTVEVVRADSARRNLPLGGKMTVVANEDVGKFYDDFYRFLSSCGIDGVKTDAQFMVDTWVSAKARRELIDAYLDAWTIASLRHFSIKVISCMSQAPQILFYSQLPQNRPPILCRNSDDFFPEIPASHPWHIWANAHNSLFTQHLNVLPDWDMFQTVHDYSGFHAAARCVSGGPIYITDVPGQHNMDLIRQMTGLTPRGKTVIFRPSVLGISIDQYVGYEDNSLLKIGAYHGSAANGTSILGFFNISSRALTDIVPLSRFRGIIPSEHYVVRAHNSGRITKPLQVGSTQALLSVSLAVRGYDILCAYPLSVFASEIHGRVYLANLGLVGKMTGCAAVLTNSFQLLENGRLFVDTTVKTLGVLGIYVSILPDLSIDGDFMVTIQGQPIPLHTVKKGGEQIVEIDIETAWNEMGLETGWANEVEVKAYFNMDKRIQQ